MTSKRKQQKAERKEPSPEEQMRRLEELERRVLPEPRPERKDEADQAMRLFLLNPKKLREWKRKAVRGIERHYRRDPKKLLKWKARAIAGIERFYRQRMRELKRTRSELIQS
jgi:cell division protein FtsN